MSALVSNTRLRSAVLLAVPAAMIVIGVAACSQDSTTTTATASSSPTVASGSTPSATASAEPGADGGLGAAPSTPDGGVGAGAVPACAATDLKPSLIAQPQSSEGSSRMALLTMTNTSGKACSLVGSPVVTLVNAANEAVQVSTTNVDQPGPSVRSELRPGGGAFAGLKWTTCDKGSADCPAGNTIKIGLAKNGTAVVANLDGFPSPEKSDITMKSLQVGTFQPSQQGVVAW